MYSAFVRDAIESAQNYYEYAKNNNTSRNVVNVIEISKETDTTYRIQLHQKLKHSDSFGIQVTSSFIRDEWYSKKEENFISTNLYEIIKIDTTPPSILIEIRPPLSDVFSKLKPHDLKIVSDLKFLIEKIKNWYEEFGEKIYVPPFPRIKGNEIYFRGNEKNGKESAEQKKAIKTALSENISYIWGAPGTGKTQFVLADCLLTYIKKGERVIVLAPTNNAIEQSLLSVINTLQQQGESIDCLYRLGIASASFAKKYPELCERLDYHVKIKSLEDEIKILNAQLLKEQDADRVIENYNCFSTIFSVAEKAHIAISNLSLQKEAAEFNLKTKEADVQDLSQGIALVTNKITAIDNEEASFAFKFQNLFSKEKHLQNQYQKSELQEELNNFQNTYNEVITVKEELLKELEAIKAKIETETKQQNKAAENAQTILSQTFMGQSFTSMRSANEFFKNAVAAAHKIVKDPSLSQNIASKRRELEELKEDKETKFATKQVFAFTVDYFFSHYSYFLENCPYEISHVFLDEAAYCPLIKSGILFSLDAPVTLLGDHMQLMPICEANDGSVNKIEEKIFLWAQSAIYFSEIFENGASLKKLFETYKNVKQSQKLIQANQPSANHLPTATLTKTHRFGDSLAKILDEFVYKNNFKGISDKNNLSTTQIYFIHAGATPEEKGQRISSEEIRQIKTYLSYSDTKNCAIMTPYKKQRDLLQRQLGNLIDRDNILTVHASQGREWDTVILSVVDSEYNNMHFTNSNSIDGIHTINTAISRVKRNLIIVCDTNYWRTRSKRQLISSLISLPTAKPVPPPPQGSFNIQWSENKERYEEGIENERLQTAVREQNQIYARFISNIKITPHKPPYAKVDIRSMSPKGRTKYTTSLYDCNCADYKNNLKGSSPCKHIFALALKLRLIDSDGSFNNSISIPSTNVDIIE